MIYVGIIHFIDASDIIHKLKSVLSAYTNRHTVISKPSITLMCGKLLNTEDIDDIWENESSIVIGRIFDKSKKCSFSKKDFANLTFLNKEEVLLKIWGKYIYIQMCPKSSQFNIVIDLTGQIPFFYHTLPNGNVLFASDIELLIKMLKNKPEYNWTYFCSYLIYGNSSTTYTPFEDIYELPPACCINITKNGKKTEPLWNPLSSYKTQYIETKDAVSILQESLTPWIEPYKNICVSLSGGLDSSALVYCLKNILKKDQTLIALNYFHASVKSSNEVVHARKVCKETGIELIELESSDAIPFSIPHNNQLLLPNKPFSGLIAARWNEKISDCISNIGFCSFLSGHGSDHIFMRPPSKKSLADYILTKGFKGYKTQLSNITQFYRDPIYSILKENTLSLISYIFACRFEKRHAQSIIDETPNWIKPTLHLKTSPSFVHPIYQTLPKKIFPGKYNQIDNLYEGLASIHVEMDRINQSCYPFFFNQLLSSHSLCLLLSFSLMDMIAILYASLLVIGLKQILLGGETKAKLLVLFN